MDVFHLWLREYGPNEWLRALIIAGASLAVAVLVDWIVLRLIGRWTRKTTTDVDDRLVSMLHAPLFVSVIVVGLMLATIQLPLAEFSEWLTLAILETIVIGLWMLFAVRFTRLSLEVLSRHQDRFRIVQRRTLPLFNNLAALVLFGAGVYFLLLAWEIDVTGWLASAGIVGIAISFAAKDTLANLFAGVFILADAPYKVGDFVILDTGERGRVTHIGIRSTRMLTRDDVEITIPNAVMGNSKIVNESGGPYEKERVRVQVGVAYGTDIDQVREVLMDIAIAHPAVHGHPEPLVRFRRFGDSGLEFELLGWIDEPVLRGSTIDALNCEVYKRFMAEGIEIPYPKRDVYVRELPPVVPRE